MSIYRKQNGKCTHVTNRIYRSLHAISYFPVVLGFLVDTIAVVGIPIVFNCSTWSFIMASRARQATMIAWRRRRLLHSVIRDITREESFKLFQEPVAGKDCKGIFHWPYFYAILLFFANALHLGKSFSVLFITDLNTALIVERSLTAAVSYISSASVMLECWQNLSKLTNQRVYQILVYWNDLLLSLPTDVLSLPLAPLFYFFARCFLRRALTNWTPGRG